jgi:hypothetical protein
MTKLNRELEGMNKEQKRAKSKRKLPVPGQPTHDIMISMADPQDLLTPPPDGHGGVWFSKTLRNIEPLHRLRFYFANSPEETVALVTVTFIEGPGKSVRPDLEQHSKSESHYKIHWIR